MSVLVCQGSSRQHKAATYHCLQLVSSEKRKKGYRHYSGHPFPDSSHLLIKFMESWKRTKTKSSLHVCLHLLGTLLCWYQALHIVLLQRTPQRRTERQALGTALHIQHYWVHLNWWQDTTTFMINYSHTHSKHSTGQWWCHTSPELYCQGTGTLGSGGGCSVCVHMALSVSLFLRSWQRKYRGA